MDRVDHAGNQSDETIHQLAAEIAALTPFVRNDKQKTNTRFRTKPGMTFSLCHCGEALAASGAWRFHGNIFFIVFIK